MPEVRNASGHLPALQVVKVPLPIVASTDEQDTGENLQTGDVILDAFVRVETAESTGGAPTMDVGLLSSESGGDADGLLDGVSVGTAGTVRGSLASGGQTLGALLREDEDGAGALVPAKHVVGDAVSISYSLGSDDFAELDASLYLLVFRPYDRE